MVAGILLNILASSEKLLQYVLMSLFDLDNKKNSATECCIPFRVSLFPLSVLGRVTTSKCFESRATAFSSLLHMKNFSFGYLDISALKSSGGLFLAKRVSSCPPL